MTASARKPRRERNVWLLAWALTLVLHVAALIGFRHFSPIPSAAAAAVHRPEPIELVFSQPPPTASRNTAPQFFSELPPDRADRAPAKAQFLSNVTSRARDREGGADAALPKMQGEGDAPQVKLDTKGSPSHAASTSPTVAQPAPSAPARTAETGTTPGPREPARTATSATTAPQTIRANDAGNEAQPGSSDNFEIRQEEMANPNGGATLTGDVSLNTTAWNYAPWLMRFRMELLRRWIAPPAYYLGILKDGGWAVVQVEIARSGKLVRIELLEQHGHPSLIGAAEGAVRSMAPYEALPDDFPEPTLILRIRMVYPRIRPR